MANVTRRIGLSLGADICWPLCFEELVRRLDLHLPIDGDTVSFEVERVTIEPYDLRQEVRYDVVLDRLAHWMLTSREWIKKAILLDDTYVLNNPWSFQAMEKQTSYCAMMRLGLPVPDTWMVPPKEHAPSEDLGPTLRRYAKLFDLGAIGGRLGYPLFMKPYDGGAWKGVTRIENEGQLRLVYEQSGRLVMHLQAAVEPFEHFVRCIGMGPQTRVMRYEPSAPHHERYQLARDFVSDDDRRLLEDMTLTINSFFGWDFNSCEALLKDGTWHPIDFANACPDSQVNSLHYHFPWIVLAKLRWSLFCAATRRPMRMNQDWRPFLEVVERQPDLPLRERLAAFAAIARERYEQERFEAFCAEHLPHLDELALEFFGSEQARAAVREKVAAIFPAHEVEEFTQLFWDRIQLWREHEREDRS
jgi:hypothetical protein